VKSQSYAQAVRGQTIRKVEDKGEKGLTDKKLR